MRVLVCTFVILATACGKADRDPITESSGGTHGTLGGTSMGGSAGGANAEAGRSPGGASAGGRSSGGFSASGGVSNGGVTSAGATGAASGASPTAGGAGSSSVSGAGGSSGDGAGGNGVTGGEGGESGAISSCGDTYTACGCGCCGGVTPTKRCFYPEIAGHLASIIEEDESIRGRPDCANAGCSSPQEYVCCTSDQATLSEATYKVTVVPTALDRLTISRTDDEFCDSITFVNPSAARNEFMIEAPAKDWVVQDTQVAFCSQSSINRAIGGVGHLSWHGAPCVADFDFTLFASFEQGGRRAVRFKAENVPLSNGTLFGCD